MRYTRFFSQALSRGPAFLAYLAIGQWWGAVAGKLDRWVEAQGRRRTAIFLLLGLFVLAAWVTWAGSGPLFVIGLVLIVGGISWRSRRAGSRGISLHAEESANWDADGIDPADGAVSAGESLGVFDNDGHLVPRSVADESVGFSSRYRFDLEVLGSEAGPIVRKDYRGTHAACRRECGALSRIASRANVPRLVSVDRTGSRVFKTFIPGPTLREVLAEAGARILSAQEEADRELARLDGLDRLSAVWQRGRECLLRLDPVGPYRGGGGQLVERMAREMDRIHALGVTGFSLTFGNIVLQESDGQPWFIDFDSAHVAADLSSTRFRLRRDRDRRWFNRIYGSDLLTEESARLQLRGPLQTPYSPVDFGWGLTTRGFWSTDSGSGRWERWNGPVMRPIVAGRRVLDLGCHNAVMPLMMLRAGASHVTAVERDPDALRVGRGLLGIAEWHDLCDYDLQLIEGEILEYVNSNGRDFDVATALCSLYYLPESEMREVIGLLAESVPVLVLQAKTDTDPSAADDKARKSSLRFNQKLLEENGFPHVEIFTARGWSRPLLIGRREATK